MTESKTQNQNQSAPAQMTRDALRSKIFSGNKFKSETIEMFGGHIEVRQPSLGDVLNARDTGDSLEALLDLIITYCYVPGSEQKVFEEGDKENLKALPFGSDISRLNAAITKLTDIDVLGEEKN